VLYLGRRRLLKHGLDADAAILLLLNFDCKEAMYSLSRLAMQE
jgi:hypothetical protein